MDQDLVLERVEWRIVDMPTLGLDHVAGIEASEQCRNAKPCARPDDRDDSIAGRWPVLPADMAKKAFVQPGDGMRHRAKIIDNQMPVDVELHAALVGLDDPWIIGQLQNIAADGPSEGDGNLARQWGPDVAAVGLPRQLEGGLLSGS